ncbi:hypothetical protein [Deinococcus altitudinis]|uniref:hypothetical protein n=1 Tax=Deinococcus altitudinis TaxID=468914 RepID=UPI003891D47C
MTKGKSLSIGAAMKNRMQEQEPVEQKFSAKAATPVESAPTPVSEVLESFNTRLPAGLHRRLKLHAAGAGMKIQDVVNTALEAYLNEKERK